MQKSFKDSAREELLGVLPKKREEIVAFLSALAKSCGSIEIAKRDTISAFGLPTTTRV